MMEREIRMTDFPPDIFAEIPVELFCYCHCNPRIVLLDRKFTSCANCDGTTWRFSEMAERHGYFGRKIRSLPWQAITKLPYRYFERCDCDEKPKSHEEREFIEIVLECLNSAALP